jgi:hypothetical protein
MLEAGALAFLAEGAWMEGADTYRLPYPYVLAFYYNK